MATRTAEKAKPSSLGDQLTEAYHLLEAGNPAEALAGVKKAKELEPKNVYVLAFEKQLEQYISLQSTNTLTDEQRVDIVESIPGIIERAAEGAAVAQLTAERNQTLDTNTSDDKSAALEWLKDQYFQHAHDYVQKEQYSHALAEIRRVFIIDQNNATAREFEKRIEHLISLTSEALPPPAPAPPPLRLVTKESLRASERAEEEPPAAESVSEPAPSPAAQPLPPLEGTKPSSDDLEKIIVKTEEWSAPAGMERAEEASTAKLVTPEKRRGIRPALTFAIIILVVAIGASVFLMWTRHQEDKRAEARRSTAISNAQPETFLGPQTTAEEQTFVIGTQTDEGSDQAAQVEEETPPAPAKPESTKPEAKTRKSPSKTTSKRENSKTPAKTENPPASTAEQTSPETSNPPPTQTSTTDESAPEQQSPAPAATEKAAEILKMARIEFPQNSALDQYQGQIVVQVQIDKSGNPIQTKVVNTTNPLLTTPVTDAIMKSKFSPAQSSSGPVTSWMTIPFRIKR